MKAVRLVIKGRVQGVGFRYFVLHQARLFGVRGFVKNQQDGSVLVEAVGEEEIINHFIECCRQGPPLAKVTELLVNSSLFTDYEDFKIK